MLDLHSGSEYGAARIAAMIAAAVTIVLRSEERRVGKEC